MLSAIIEPRLAAAERRTGESADYLREMATVSPAAFAKFALFTPMAQHRGCVPPDAYAVARIVATKREDCGPCLQTVVNLSLVDGVDRDIIKAAVTGRPDNLPPPLAGVYRFAHSVACGSPHVDASAGGVEAYVGRAGMIDLALGIATGACFPDRETRPWVCDELRRVSGRGVI